MKTQSRILELVGKALNYQFETYSWEKMIDDTTGLTKREKEWAKKNIDYKAYICE